MPTYIAGLFTQGDITPGKLSSLRLKPNMASPRGSGRILRLVLFAAVLLFCGYSLNKSTGSLSNVAVNVPQQEQQQAPPVARDEPQDVILEPEQDDEEADAPPKTPKKAVPRKKAPKRVKKPKKGEEDEEIVVSGNAAGPKGTVKAAFVALARNTDIESMTKSIRQIENRFNKNYNYDWVFLNDEPFTAKFKKAISRVVSGKAKFGTVPEEQWSFPEWIDKERAAYAREDMVQNKVIYGGSVSYRHMCRYESGFFYKHPLLDEYEYFWRVDPDIKIFCDIDYDVFQYMKDNNKMYGFTISLYEYKETIPTLWDTTKEFMDEYPEYLDEDNNLAWISDDGGNSYNGCHFWSNFEVASLEFFRLEAYNKYFEYLDQAGGFFYERWGDAPVHSIAASLFLPRDAIHFFGDVGYFHNPFSNCPVDEETRKAKHCVCRPKTDFTWRGHSCTPRFFRLLGLKRPKGWENFTG